MRKQMPKKPNDLKNKVFNPNKPNESPYSGKMIRFFAIHVAKDQPAFQ